MIKKTPHKVRNAPSERNARQLSGIALPPKNRQEQLPDAWLKSLKQWGYFALALQNDPTLPRKGGEENHRDGLYRLHFLYDLGAETPRAESLAYFKSASKKARKHGLKVYLDCWEPSIPITVWEELPKAWQGHTGGVPRPMSLDIENPEAAAWYWAIIRRAMERLPEIDGVILGREDNDAVLADPPDPEALVPKPAIRWARFYRRFFETLQVVNPALEMILYDWWWPEGDHAAILGALPADVQVVTRFENNTRPYSHPDFVRGESLINDVNVAVDKPMKDAAKIIAFFRKRGNPLYAMVPFIGPIECFMQPYALAPGMYLRKLHGLREAGFHGWMDYDCGGIDSGMTADLLETYGRHPGAGIERQLSEFVRMRYGTAAADGCRDAFNHFEKAIELFPLDVHTRPNRMLNGLGISAALCMGLPLRPQDAWEGRADWERPEGRGGFDPHNYTEPRSLERIISRLPLVIGEQEEGLSRLATLLGLPGTSAQKQARSYDHALGSAYLQVLRSMFHFFGMAGILQKVRRDNRLIPADLKTLDYLREAEMENTQTFAELLRRHPEFYVNSTHDVWKYLSDYDKRLPNSPESLVRKQSLLAGIDWTKTIRTLGPTVALD